MSGLLLFDIDGTLIKGSRAHSRAFSEAIEKVYGISTSIDIIEHHGMTDSEIIIELLRRIGLDEQVVQSKLEDCLQMLVKSFDKLFEQDEVIVLPGVEELLRELGKLNVLMGLVTGNLESIAKLKLKRVGLSSYFRFGAFGSDGKKRANLVKLAIRRADESFGFKSNSNVFLFGDTPRDMIAGKENGVKTVGVATGIYTEEQLRDAGADFVLKDLRNTDKILKIIL